MIDDLCLLQQPFIENIEEVLDRFERTYAHLREDMPFLFRDHEFYDFLLYMLSWCDKRNRKSSRI